MAYGMMECAATVTGLDPVDPVPTGGIGEIWVRCDWTSRLEQVARLSLFPVNARQLPATVE